jgi:hypothetical protein
MSDTARIIYLPSVSAALHLRDNTKKKFMCQFEVNTFGTIEVICCSPSDPSNIDIMRAYAEGFRDGLEVGQ